MTFTEFREEHDADYQVIIKIIDHAQEAIELSDTVGDDYSKLDPLQYENILRMDLPILTKIIVKLDNEARLPDVEFTDEERKEFNNSIMKFLKTSAQISLFINTVYMKIFKYRFGIQ